MVDRCWNFDKETFEEMTELRGVIDMHVHIGPDVRPRRMDVIDLATEMRDADMAAFLIKPLGFTSLDKAYFAEREVPGIRAFGGIKFSHSVGGININALEDALNMPRRYFKGVWMPTTESVLHASEEAKRRAPMYYDRGYSIPQESGRDPLHISKGGKIVPELEPILSRIAEERDLILGTSHYSPDDSLTLIDAARSVGIDKVTVTHPNAPMIDATIDQMKEMAKKGAYLEFNFVYTYGIYGGENPASIAEKIKAIGPQNCLMVTDMGQPTVPSPVEGMREFIRTMKLNGINQQEIDIITKENPRKLLQI